MKDAIKAYWCWTSIFSFVFLTILAIGKLSTGVPNDIPFIVAEWILLLLFVVPPLIYMFRKDKGE